MRSAALEALLVLVACVLLYAPGLATVPFYTRGEPREGLVAREMLRTGEWLVPARPAGELARKPPLYYWAAASALRQLPAWPELALRLPSAVFAAVAVLGTWATARAVAGRAAALPAALILASAFEWTRAATSARVDMTLAAALSFVLAGWLLALVRGRAWLVLAVVGATLGTLAKGPVALVLPALAAGALLAMERRRDVLRPLRPVVVVGAAAALAGVWYAVALLRQGGAFAGVVARENWQRFVAGEEHVHGAGYLVPMALVGLLPWTPLLPLALVPLRRAARRPATVLIAGWIVTGFVFFSLSAAKRSVYLLSLYPAIALLLGAGVAAPGDEGGLRRAARLAAALYVPGGLALAAVGALVVAGVDPAAPLGRFLRPADAAGAAAVAGAARAATPVLAALVVVTVAGVVVVRRASARDRWRSVTVAIATLAVAWTAFFGTWVHPELARRSSLRDFLARVDTLVPADASLHATFPADPGLRFYAPRPVVPWRPATGEGGWVLLWEDEHERLAAAPDVVARSDAQQGRRGRLVLADVPPGVRTGSRSP